MISSLVVIRRIACMVLALGAMALLAACDQEHQSLSGRSLASIPNDTMALMQDKGVSSDSPVLIRTYKQEAELEIWKKRPDGRYVYLKTFPMCRWSGQLGPKMHEGDRQVPEGRRHHGAWHLFVGGLFLDDQ
jgi:murein L,D-transpeptidase YafK